MWKDTSTGGLGISFQGNYSVAAISINNANSNNHAINVAGGQEICVNGASGCLSYTSAQINVDTSFNAAGGITTSTLSTSSTLKFSGSFTANGTTATALTSLGPSSAHATVQEWFTVQDSAGTVRYIPAF